MTNQASTFAPISHNNMQNLPVSPFLQRVEAEILSRRLLTGGKQFLVGVSGGVDSMVLLFILHTLSAKHHWKITVAHFNHHLRARASSADENLVISTAESWGLPLVIEHGEVKKVAALSKISVEMAARKLRHEFFARVARTGRFSGVALAHHADDQVELFFLRLLRGAGGAGLAGMKYRSTSPADEKTTLIRPMLDFPKTEILTFAKANKISFREDQSNFSCDFLRNRIRNHLLPLLRNEYQPGLTNTVLRTMAITRAEAELADEVASNWLASQNPATPVPGKTEFCNLPTAVQRKVLLGQLTAQGFVSDFDLIEKLRAMPEQTVSIGPALWVSRDEFGKVKSQGNVVENFNFKRQELKLQGKGGNFRFGRKVFSWSYQNILSGKSWQPVARCPQVEEFDANKVGSEITLRYWRAGDRFQPMGLPSAVKLQDLFMNAKIPAARRRSLILAATAAGEIFWVENLRIGENFKLTPETQSKLIWQWRPDSGKR